MGEHFETLTGILGLIDIVNFTPQANEMGDEYTAKYTQYFESEIKRIVEARGFDVIKSLGDAVLIFGTQPSQLLDIMLSLFGDEKPKDMYGFKTKFRMVAHFGFFQFKMMGDKPVDLVSAEGIKVFRMEKQAKTWELVVTRELFRGLKSLFEGKGVTYTEMKSSKKLKGFDDEYWHPPFYKLRLPEKQGIQGIGVSDLLSHTMAQLEESVKEIPVFGNLYPSVDMERNFIDLEIEDNNETGKRKEIRECDFKEYMRIEGHKSLERFSGYEYERKFTANALYKKYKKGIIYGLPGAGKTTILQNFAHNEFKNNNDTETKRIVLFVRCRSILCYDNWYTAWHREDPGYHVKSALEYFTYCFLFNDAPIAKLTPHERDLLQRAQQEVCEAFNSHRLTLLVDALDECPDSRTKERVAQLFKKLNVEIEEGNIKDDEKSFNRLFLTSRPLERTYLSGVEAPVFNVLSLNMEQVRDMARYFYGEESALYKKFDEGIWRDDIVVKVAGTPMTALLVIVYFKTYERFDTRYMMYDLLMKFILLGLWKAIKEDSFEYKNMDDFFEQARKHDIFSIYPSVGDMYNALCRLAFDCFYDMTDNKIARTVKEDTIVWYLEDYAANAQTPSAEEWLERFRQDHLLLASGYKEYVFIHSTVMEYLASRHIIEGIRSGKDHLAQALSVISNEHFRLETLPIASGSNLQNGFGILKRLKALVDLGGGDIKDLVYIMGFKCLAEVEACEEKIFDNLQTKSVRKGIEDIISSNVEVWEWVYAYLKRLVTVADKKVLDDTIKMFENVAKLSRSKFLTGYLSYDEYNSGDSGTVEVRKNLLYRLVRKEIVDAWAEYVKGDAVKTVQDETFNLLRLDSVGYHTDDKNFNYHSKLVGKELIGFLGSPNLKHSNAVISGSYSPDGRYIVSASDDNTLKIWDAQSGKEIRSLEGHGNAVISGSYSPDGRYIVSASSDKTLKIWEAESGKEIRSLEGHKDYVISGSYSPDGRYIVSASSDKTLKIWDAQSGKEIRSLEGHRREVRSGSYSPDGRYIVSASDDNTLKIWEAESGKEIRSLEGHKHWVNSGSYSPDGRYIVSASSDKTLKIWEAESGKEIRSLEGHKHWVNSGSYSPDGRYIVSASSDKTLKIWEAESGKEIRSLEGHRREVRSGSYSPDGRYIVSASSDKTLKIWEAESGKEIRSLEGHKHWVNSGSYSPDGRYIVSVSSDNTLKIWEAESGKEIRSLEGHRREVRSGSYSPDGRYIVSASSDKTLKIWDAQSGKEIRSLEGHRREVRSGSYSPDGRYIVSVSDDNTLKIWDAQSGKEIRSLEGHGNAVISGSYSPDGRYIVSASSDKTLKIWDAQSGKEIRSLEGHKDYVRSGSYSPDGRYIVSASSDKTLKIWEAESGKEIRSLEGHGNAVRSGSYSPDGRYIVSASYDNTLKIWNAESGKCIKTITLRWMPTGVSFDRNKFGMVVTSNANCTLTLFDLSEVLR